MSLPVKFDTSDLCGSHGSLARVLLVGNYSEKALPKIWPCGGASLASPTISSATVTNFVQKNASPPSQRLELWLEYRQRERLVGGRL